MGEREIVTMYDKIIILPRRKAING